MIGVALEKTKPANGLEVEVTRMKEGIGGTKMLTLQTESLGPGN